MKLMQLLSRLLAKSGRRRAQWLQKTVNAAATVESSLEPRLLLSGTNEPSPETLSAPDNFPTASVPEAQLGNSAEADRLLLIGSTTHLVENSRNQFQSAAVGTAVSSTDKAAGSIAVSDTLDALHSVRVQYFSSADSSQWQDDQSQSGTVFDTVPTNPGEMVTESLARPFNPTTTTETASSQASAINSDFESSPSTSSETAPDTLGDTSLKSDNAVVDERKQPTRQTLTGRQLLRIRPSTKFVENSSTAVPTIAERGASSQQTHTSTRSNIVASTHRTTGDGNQMLTVPGSDATTSDHDEQHLQPWQSSITATTAEFQRLLNSFVQFDTVEMLTIEIANSADWLSQQLISNELADTGSDSIELAANGTYADQPGQQESREFDEQQIKRTGSRIDFGGLVESVLIMLSEDPPEPPEVAGVWQQMKFDCIPRGPPQSDGLPASEFTRLTGSAIQLQQLRHSIAPRGPSAASVN